MASAIQNLLDELSWEGTSVSYRGGGPGQENVLTAEVWQALDVLPRKAFLGNVLEKAPRVVPAVSTDESTSQPLVGAALSRSMECEVLCGDRRSTIGGIRVQPDVLLESPDAVVIVEAKRVRGGVFQREQIARNVLVLDEMRAGRAALLLLVLGSAPPVPVRALGRLTVADALGVGLGAIRERDPRVPEPENVGAEIAWITWAEISDIVRDTNRTFTNGDPDVVDAVRRSAEQIINAVHFHTPSGAPAPLLRAGVVIEGGMAPRGAGESRNLPILTQRRIDLDACRRTHRNPRPNRKSPTRCDNAPSGASPPWAAPTRCRTAPSGTSSTYGVTLQCGPFSHRSSTLRRARLLAHRA